MSTPVARNTIYSVYSLTRSSTGIQRKKSTHARLCYAVTETAQIAPVIVTGSTGRLGRLLRRDWALSPPPGMVPICTARSGEADLVLPGEGPLPPLPSVRAVVALWGETSNDPERLDRNIALAHRTREVARACGARLVVHLSSAAVYGPGRARDETMPPAPLTPYGRSKLEMERVVAGFASDPARHVCLRLANVVGADSLAPALSSDRPVTLDRFDGGAGPTRAYIAPGCLARVITALVACPHDALPGLLNVAAPDPVAMADLAMAAGRQITWRAAPETAVQAVTLDTSRLRGLLPGLVLRRSAQDMIADWQRLRGAQ